MAHYLAPNDRPTIAFFTAEIEGEYSSTLCQGALDCAEANDVNLIVFPGKAINSPYSFQHQYNVIYDLISPDNVDALTATCFTPTLTNLKASTIITAVKGPTMPLKPQR